LDYEYHFLREFSSINEYLRYWDSRPILRKLQKYTTLKENLNYVKSMPEKILLHHRCNEISSSFFSTIAFCKFKWNPYKVIYTDRSICAATASAVPSFTFYFRPSSKQNKLLQLVRMRRTEKFFFFLLLCTERNLSFFSVKQHKKIINQWGILTRLWEHIENERKYSF
jgi:hypothetical protein